MSTSQSGVELNYKELAKLAAEISAPGGGQGPIADRYNEKLIAEFRKNAGRIEGEIGGGIDLLLLTVSGAKTGKSRVIPLAYFRVHERLLILGSMGGSDKHPRWFLNARANPQVIVELGAETFSAQAIETAGSERDELFKAVCEISPVFAKYQGKTDRKIPVLELKRTPSC